MPTTRKEIRDKALKIKNALKASPNLTIFPQTELNELKNLVEQAQQSNKDINSSVIRTIVYDVFAKLSKKMSPQELRAVLAEHMTWMLNLAFSLTTESAVITFENSSNRYPDMICRLHEIANVITGLGELAKKRILPLQTNDQTYSFILKLMQQFLRLLNKRKNSEKPISHEEMGNLNKSIYGMLFGLRDLLQESYLSESIYPAILNEINNLNDMVGLQGVASQFESIQSQIFSILNPTPVRVASVETAPALRSASVTVAMPPYYGVQQPPIDPFLFNWLLNQLIVNPMRSNQPQPTTVPTLLSPAFFSHSPTQNSHSSSESVRVGTAHTTTPASVNPGSIVERPLAIDSGSFKKPACYSLNPYGKNDSDVFVAQEGIQAPQNRRVR